MQAPQLPPLVTVQRVDQGSSLARQLVAEMMILAGEVIGDYGALHPLCFVDWNAVRLQCWI